MRERDSNPRPLHLGSLNPTALNSGCSLLRGARSRIRAFASHPGRSELLDSVVKICDDFPGLRETLETMMRIHRSFAERFSTGALVALVQSGDVDRLLEIFQNGEKMPNDLWLKFSNVTPHDSSSAFADALKAKVRTAPTSS